MVRLKQCECAVSDGRLDEAYDLLRQPDLHAHRQGQELTSRLIAALVERGRHHLAAGRLNQAAADAEKAAQLGGNLADVAQLRSAVNFAQRNGEQANRQIAQALAVARRHADQGQLTVGQNLLNGVQTSDARVNGFKEDLAARRAGLESRLNKASVALDAGDWQTAVDHLSVVNRNEAQDVALRQLCGKINQHVAGEITREFESGRLNVAGAMLARLDRLPAQSIETDHLRKSLEQCRSACDAIEAGQPQDAGDVLRRLHALWPNAAWLAEAAEQAQRLGAAFSSVRASPLFLAGSISPQTIPLPPVRQAPPLPRAAQQIPGPSLFLHVDGVGSFQLFTGSAISLGPAGSSRTVDVPLMLDISVPTVTVTRSDDDYFLRASKAVLVNNVQTTNKLLNNGDEIGLGNRCRITFRRPSAASSSAVLDLSGARLPGASVRQVLLLDRELIFGPGTAAHIRVDDLQSPVVLQKREGGLVCRAASPITIDDRPAGTTAEVSPGAHVSVASLRFVVAREQRP